MESPFGKSSTRSNDASALGWRRWLGLLGLFAASRLLILWTAAIALRAFNKGPFYAAALSFADRFSGWDAGWYLSITNHGYLFDPAAPGQSNVGFYPVYPLLIWLVNGLGLHNSLFAGYLVSNAALLVAGALLWKLAVTELDSPGAADRAVSLLFFWPGAFWFSMIYTESIFLALLLGALLLCRQRRWLLAALAGYALALTRAPGVLVSVFFLVEIVAEWRERRLSAAALGFPPPSPRFSALASRGLALAAPALGHGSFLAYLRWKFGDWTVQRQALVAGWPDTALHGLWSNFQSQWERLEPLHRTLGYPLLGLALVALGVSWMATRRLAYPALGGAFVVLYLCTTEYTHFPRYLAVVPPIFLAGGWVSDHSRLLEILLLAGSAALLALLTALLVCGYAIN
ncbi:MAG: hypothetical protein JO117_00405 [Verrucomicrobia bacterium]|nr:hypothetical protein [Verrucomicrobiota bacterium]MBV9659140.1 hypothetical protein [Verrucomicrobiota bacterium]